VIVDSHQHFWDLQRFDYPWMTDDLEPIRRNFGPSDLEPLLAERGVDRTVVVQANPSVDETRYLLEIAAQTDFVSGVVGWVDLADPGIRAVVTDLRNGENGHHLVGIRHQVHDESDPAWLLRDEVQRGLRELGAAGLPYDLLVRARELPAALQTARAQPGLRLVIDHIAKPPIEDGEVEEWARSMAPFAGLDNVYCKLSGMVTEADWNAWKPADLVPYVQRVVDWFGEDRLMFGSDWPVCLLAATYGEVMDALDSALGGLGERARAKIYGLNAVAFYGLRDAQASSALSHRDACEALTRLRRHCLSRPVIEI
jgi:L-fuconolactonase